MISSCDCLHSDIWDSDNDNNGCSSSQSIPLEFIQVLIHQHAKTLVALKTLRTEVKSLTVHHGLPPPKPFADSCGKDSGHFSSSNNDELYSLLSQIERKVSNLKKPSSYPLIGSGGSNGTVGYGGGNLGSLDNQLGNKNFNFAKFNKVERSVIKKILECENLQELKRQLIFEHSKVESLSHKVNELETENTDLRRRLKEHEDQNRRRFKALLGSHGDSLASQSRSLIPIPISRAKSAGPGHQSNSPHPKTTSAINVSSISNRTTPSTTNAVSNGSANNININNNNNNVTHSGRKKAVGSRFQWGEWFR